MVVGNWFRMTVARPKITKRVKWGGGGVVVVIVSAIFLCMVKLSGAVIQYIDPLQTCIVYCGLLYSVL